MEGEIVAATASESRPSPAQSTLDVPVHNRRESCGLNRADWLVFSDEDGECFWPTGQTRFCPSSWPFRDEETRPTHADSASAYHPLRREIAAIRRLDGAVRGLRRKPGTN